MTVMTDETSARVPAAPDEQDRIAILQMLELTPDQRLDYFADEADFETDTARVVWLDNTDGASGNRDG